MDSHKQSPHVMPPSLPAAARLPINRCNLPAVILGGLTFQQHPVALELDGVADLYAALFKKLDEMEDSGERAEHFIDSMSVYFRLHQLEDAGLDTPALTADKAADKATAKARGNARVNANYLRLLRGWFFDANGREGAVLKAWVESRFGLLTRFHASALHEPDSEASLIYQGQRSSGLCGTNALEAQLDLLYTFCQYEWRRRYPQRSHQRLYRGLNHLDEYEILHSHDKNRYQLLINNLNSFTSDPQRADEFGDTVIAMAVPASKLLYFPELLPGRFSGESEYLVIGGVYEAQRIA